LPGSHRFAIEFTGIPAFIARATTEGLERRDQDQSTFWVMKLSICEVCVLTLPAPSAS
jgi:hypothetical protein